MKNQGLTRAHKWLLGVGLVLIVTAEIVKRLPMSERETVIVGASEVILAMLVGIAFGVASSSQE
ncbi:MAG TPA: hypothetical protein VNH22_07955 [Blastocatellia bacterium]|jgi:hypothetical protein|nr:hypothetical protein [Blastocatellia bacterium]